MIGRVREWAVVTLWVLVAIPAALAGDGNEKPSAQKIVDAAITAAGRSIPAQADALARLAWPAQGGDPEVAELARLTLVNYQAYALPSIRSAIRWARPEQQADVVSALIRANEKIGYGQPSDFLGGLDDAVWFGTREARLIAIPELGRYRFTPSLISIIDAAYEEPALVPAAIDALAAIGNDRARFFLEHMLLEGDRQVRGMAASALARIGGEALLPLKVAVRSDDPELRLIAVQALLPVATVDHLSTLHEYVYSHPGDDAATVEAVRAAALMLEDVLARQTEPASSD